MSETRKLMATVSLYAGITSGLVAVGVAILIVILRCLKMRNSKIKNKALDSCNRGEELLTYEQLVQYAIKFFKNMPAARKFRDDKVGTLDDDRQLVQFGEPLPIHTSRYPELQCFMKSQVQVSGAPKYTLHMNRMFDCNGNAVYLAQAPLKDETELFVQAVINENIGLVVWVGDLLNNSKEIEFQPYFPTKRMGSVRLGSYSAKNLGNFYGKSEGFDQFDIGILKRTSEGPPVENKLHIVHTTFWPKGDNWDECVKLAKIVKHIWQLAKKQQKVSLRGVLFHCFDGVTRSAAVCAIYLGYQMWLKKERVSLAGIMRYIRKNRHCAFTYGPDSEALLPIVFGTVEVLACVGDDFRPILTQNV